jgi:hypothetical protein
MIETPRHPEKMNAQASKSNGSEETPWLKTVDPRVFSDQPALPGIDDAR